MIYHDETSDKKKLFNNNIMPIKQEIKINGMYFIINFM